MVGETAAGMRPSPERDTGELRHEDREVSQAPEGAGPLLQRDYVAVVRDSRCSPEEAIETILADFPGFSPDSLARFWRPEGSTGPLRVGDRMGIDLAGYGYCEVEITQVEPRTMTMRTIEGHAEAGRISFAAYRDEAGRLVARIRSRARASNPFLYVGHVLVAQHIQSRIWIVFLERLAAACGGRMLGEVIVETDEDDDSRADRGTAEFPAIQVHAGTCPES